MGEFQQYVDCISKKLDFCVSFVLLIKGTNTHWAAGAAGWPGVPRGQAEPIHAGQTQGTCLFHNLHEPWWTEALSISFANTQRKGNTSAHTLLL